MKTLLAYRHTALMIALAALLLIAEPITASEAFGYLFLVMVPVFAMIEWLAITEEKHGL
jgi:hypothetical protein